MTIHLLEFNRIEVYEAGATLITLLAFPGRSEEHRWEDIHAALCHYALRAKCAWDPEWGLSPQRIKPFYALRTLGDVSKDLRTVPRRLRDRLAAGRMAMGFLKDVATGEVPPHFRRV